jgi:hypothetical protein
LVETIVAAVIIAIVSLAIIAVVSVILNSQQRIYTSKTNAESVEVQITGGGTPAGNAGVALDLSGGYKLQSGAETFTDGQRSYTVFEGAKPPVVQALYIGDGANAHVGKGICIETGGRGGGGILPSVYPYMIPADGYYRLEAWGARGGDGNDAQNDPGGQGGYATGTLWLKAGTKVYLRVGGGGRTGNDAAGGYNGGGKASTNASSATSGNRIGSGGGATDVRLLADSLYNRVVVAGGGGGGGGDDPLVSPSSATVKRGGNGGGGIGEDGKTEVIYSGKGGGQSGGGNTASTGGDTTNGPGTFGWGGTTTTPSRTGGGGGGGWYGGGAGSWEGGGGGSGWVFTEAAFNAWIDGTHKPQYLLDDYGKTYHLSKAANLAFDDALYVAHPGGNDKRGGFIRISYLGWSLP